MQQIKKHNLKILAKRIKELRNKNSTSLNKFVFSKGGITTATWSRVENALVDVKFTTLVQISSMLGMPLHELVFDLKLDYTLEEDLK